MMIRCPTCSSSYDLPVSLFGTRGRTLRCAQCRECWTVRAEGQARNNVFALFGADHGPEIVAEARSARRTQAPKRPPGPHQRARVAGSLRRSWRKAATLVVGLSALAGAMGALARKDDLVRLAPRTAALFEAVGLPVNLRGLALGDVHGTVEASAEGSAPVLTLEGKISNLRAEAATVPRLRFTVRDKTRTALYTWTAPAPKARLDAGETMVFRSRLATPPEAGRDLVVGFAEAADAPRPDAEHR